MAERTEILTQTEFARRVGVSVSRISQLVKAKRLPTAADGKRLVWPAARDVWIADHAGQAEPIGSGGSASPSGAGSDQPSSDVGRRLAEHRHALDSATSTASAAAQLAKARAADKVFQAKTRELHFKRLEGSLVSRADVDADAANVGALIRSTLMGIPSKMAPLLAGQVLDVAAVERMLSDEIEAALAHLHESRFRKEDKK